MPQECIYIYVYCPCIPSYYRKKGKCVKKYSRRLMAEGFFTEGGREMSGCKAVLMDEAGVERALKRISHEIPEKNKGW